MKADAAALRGVEGRVGDALFTRVQQRVLALLFGSPDRSFYATELIQLAQSGSGAVQRELRRLAAAGIVSVTRIGKQVHYRANAESPIFAELRAIVLKTFGLVEVLRSALASLESEITAAFVFGSVAKRTESASSDVDVLVVSDTVDYGMLFQALEPAAKTLGRPVNPILYSRKELAHRRQSANAFVTKILDQPKLWIIGNERDIAA